MPIVPQNGRVAVVGAGVSGLCYSYFLRKLRPDIHISIFEQSLEPGGWIKTLKLHDHNEPVLLEKGPRTLRGVSDGTLLIVDMMRQLKLEHEVEVMKSSSAANRKWLLDNSNKLIQVPNSFPLFLKFLMSDVTDGAIQGALLEPFQKAKISLSDESIESFVLRRFGSPQLANNIISAIMHGIYSGDVSKLSIKTTMPSLVDLEKGYGSIFKAMFKKAMSKKQPKELNHALQDYERLVSPNSSLEEMGAKLKNFPILRLQSGLQAFPRALANYLQTDDKTSLHLNTKISGMNIKDCTLSISNSGAIETQKYDHIRFDAGFKTLQKITEIDSVDAAKAINDVQYSDIFLANIYTKNKKLIPKNLEGFGFLVPKRNKNPQLLLGVIYDSCTEADAVNFFDGSSKALVPHTKLTLMIGGHFFGSRGVPSSKANIRATKEVLQNILNIDLSEFNIILRDEANAESKELNLDNDSLLISYNLHESCIPLYNVGFSEIVSTIVDWVSASSHDMVSLGGPNMGKLGIPDCVVNELEAALQVK